MLVRHVFGFRVGGCAALENRPKPNKNVHKSEFFERFLALFDLLLTIKGPKRTVLETGDWRLETGDWKLETGGNCDVNARSWAEIAGLFRMLLEELDDGRHG